MPFRVKVKVIFEELKLKHNSVDNKEGNEQNESAISFPPSRPRHSLLLSFSQGD